MKLTILGAGPAYSNRVGSVGASYLVQHEGSSIVLDLGQGSFPALASSLDPSSLDGVVVSHLHPDHFIDLVPLRHYLRYELDPPGRAIVHAPAGVDARIDALHAQPGFTAEALEVRPLSEGVRTIGAFDIEARLVTHTDESYAFRVPAGAGRGLVYSGDCGRAADLAPLIQPGDVLLTEVSFGPGPVPAGAFHLDGPGVGDLAAGTRPSCVLLTHLQMGFDADETVQAVRRRFDGEVVMVAPGDVFDI
jgi:ribonuclease BN (tRNA processing enzyme)